MIEIFFFLVYLRKGATTGFDLSVESLKGLKQGAQYVITCTVKASNFADTSTDFFFTINQPPYDGNCTFNPKPDSGINFVLKIALTISGRVITCLLFTITLCHNKWYLLFFPFIFQNSINLYRSCSREPNSDSSGIKLSNIALYFSI